MVYFQQLRFANELGIVVVIFLKTFLTSFSCKRLNFRRPQHPLIVEELFC
jgi:hypothetical protein